MPIPTFEQLLRAAMDEIDLYAGPCEVKRLISYSTLSAVDEAITNEIARRKGIQHRTKVQRLILRELAEFRQSVNDAGKEAQRRYGLSGRPWPFGEIEKGKFRFNDDWLKLKYGGE